jgi:zinc protease
MGGRLFVELRDQKSLAYSVTSFDAFPVARGFMALYIGCSPDKEVESIAEFERILGEIRTRGVTAEEVERAQRYLAGTQDIGLQSTSGRAAAYAGNQTLLGRWDEHRGALAELLKVTPEDVRRVAATYLDPSRSLRVVLRASGSRP